MDSHVVINVWSYLLSCKLNLDPVGVMTRIKIKKACGVEILGNQVVLLISKQLAIVDWFVTLKQDIMMRRISPISRFKFADWLCLFADHFKQFFVKFTNQNFHSIKTFVFRETTKFLFILQAPQFRPSKSGSLPVLVCISYLPVNKSRSPGYHKLVKSPGFFTFISCFSCYLPAFLHFS